MEKREIIIKNIFNFIINYWYWFILIITISVIIGLLSRGNPNSGSYAMLTASTIGIMITIYENRKDIELQNQKNRENSIIEVNTPYFRDHLYNIKKDYKRIRDMYSLIYKNNRGNRHLGYYLIPKDFFLEYMHKKFLFKHIYSEHGENIFKKNLLTDIRGRRMINFENRIETLIQRYDEDSPQEFKNNYIERMEFSDIILIINEPVGINDYYEEIIDIIEYVKNTNEDTLFPSYTLEEIKEDFRIIKNYINRPIDEIILDKRNESVY